MLRLTYNKHIDRNQRDKKRQKRKKRIKREKHAETTEKRQRAWYEKIQRNTQYTNTHIRKHNERETCKPLKKENKNT